MGGGYWGGGHGGGSHGGGSHGEEVTREEVIELGGREGGDGGECFTSSIAYEADLDTPIEVGKIP